MNISDWVIDLASVDASATSAYPDVFKSRVAGRIKRRLASLAGLSQLSILVADLPPGVATSLRMWQSDEDEFIFVLEGTPTLVTDSGEVEMQPGQAVGFPAGRPIGHHLINRSDKLVRLIEVGAINPGGNVSHYTEDDLKQIPSPIGKGTVFVHRDGSPY